MTEPHPNTLSKLPLSTITSTLPTGLHGNPRFDQPGPPPSTAATMPPYKSRPTTPHNHLPPAPSPPKPKPTRPPHPTPQTHQDMAYIYGPASTPDLQVCALMADQIKGTRPLPPPPSTTALTPPRHSQRPRPLRLPPQLRHRHRARRRRRFPRAALPARRAVVQPRRAHRHQVPGAAEGARAAAAGDRADAAGGGAERASVDGGPSEREGR